MMGSGRADMFTEIDKLRAKLLDSSGVTADCQPSENVVSQ